MKPSCHLLLATTFIIFLSFNSKAQSKPNKYTDYDHGYYFFWNGKLDSAFLMFNRYINNPDDTLKKGAAYKYIGEIQWDIGDLYGAQQSLTTAIHTLNPLNQQHHEEIGSIYNLFGNVSLDLKQYDEAINFYNNAMVFLKGTSTMFEVMNGKATAFQKKGSYKNAIAIYDSIIALKPTDQQLIARVTDNSARTKWLLNPSNPVLNEFKAALKIRLDSQYNADLDASYIHLSDYYATFNYDSALLYAEKMHQSAKENQNPDDVLEALDKLIRLNTSSALKETLYEEFKKLNDSLQLSRDTTRNRFALIRYDVQKSKSDNLALQQHIINQRLLMYELMAAAIIIIACLYAWYSKRKKRIRQEAEDAIRNSKLKTSQKIHDVVANGLYGIMNELEHGKTIEKEPLLNKVEVLYEKSRNISYEDISLDNKLDDDNQIPQLLTSFANEYTRVILIGNEQKFWKRITKKQKHEMQLILNEVMVNMKKHSQAKNVVIIFRQEDDKAIITYTDDGIGFKTNQKFGNGLNNTVSRIKSIKGAINFEKSEKGGAAITVSFPLESNNA